jgi:hypothetical protein
MAYSEGIKGAFAPFRKSGEPPVYPVRVKDVTPSCEDFVAVCLMAYIPDKLIVRSVENIVQSDRKLHNAQASAEMTSIYGNIIDDVLA